MPGSRQRTPQPRIWGLPASDEPAAPPPPGSSPVACRRGSWAGLPFALRPAPLEFLVVPRLLFGVVPCVCGTCVRLVGARTVVVAFDAARRAVLARYCVFVALTSAVPAALLWHHPLPYLFDRARMALATAASKPCPPVPMVGRSSTRTAPRSTFTAASSSASA